MILFDLSEGLGLFLKKNLQAAKCPVPNCPWKINLNGACSVFAKVCSEKVSRSFGKLLFQESNCHLWINSCSIVRFLLSFQVSDCYETATWRDEEAKHQLLGVALAFVVIEFQRREHNSSQLLLACSAISYARTDTHARAHTHTNRLTGKCVIIVRGKCTHNSEMKRFCAICNCQWVSFVAWNADRRDVREELPAASTISWGVALLEMRLWQAVIVEEIRVHKFHNVAYAWRPGHTERGRAGTSTVETKQAIVPYHGAN